jgi:MYXO-CTERM domain-containing protein
MFAVVRNRWVAAVLAPLALVVGERAAQAAEPWDLKPDAHRWVDNFGRVVQDVCPAGEAHARCFLHWIVQPYTNVTAGNGALGADGIAAAYGLTSSIPGSGGAIVATVLAYDNNTALSDVQAYRTNYNLPPISACSGTLPMPWQSPPCLAVINQNGATSPLPSVDPGWASESSLDIEMISATCPDCSIVVVEATDPSTPNLNAAVNQAAKIPGVVAINNSYGGPEGAGDGANTAYTHAGILVVASAGDQDYMDEGYNNPPSPITPSYPASDSHVLSVGGTILKQTGGGTRGYVEQVWNEGVVNTTMGLQATGTGSGCSQQFSQPAWQAGITFGKCSMRADNDVSAAGDYINSLGSSTGVALYCNACGGGTGGHFTSVFGTSASGPMVAGIFARLKLATTVANDLGWVYRNAQSFNDVTVGSNDSATPDCSTIMCTADCGWDGPTGVGTPSAKDLLNAEADAGTSPNSPCTPFCKSGTCGSSSSSGSSSGSGSGSGSSSGGGSSSGSSSGSIGDDSGSDASIPTGDDASADAAVEGGQTDGGANNATGKSSGCGCYAVSNDSAANDAFFVLSVAGLVLVARRRKQR